MRRIYALLFMTTLWLVEASVATAAPSEPYGGVDETVVEGAAEAAGRTPYLFFEFLEQGDIPRMTSVLAGLLGGFVLGFLFRGHFHRHAHRQAGQHTSNRSEDVGA